MFGDATFCLSIHQLMDTGIISSSLLLWGICWEHPCMSLWGEVAHGMWDLSSLARNGTHTPAVVAQRLNHWTAREDPVYKSLKWRLLSCVTPQTVALQAPLSVEFSRPEY